MLWWEEGDGQLWGSGRGAIAGCHCSVLWLGVTTNFGGVDVVPLLGAIAIVVCYAGVPISVSYLPPIFRATNVTQTPEKTTMNFVLNFLQTLHCSLH